MLDEKMQAKKHAFAILKKMAMKKMMEGDGDEVAKQTKDPDDKKSAATGIENSLTNTEEDVTDPQDSLTEMEGKKKEYFSTKRVQPKAGQAIMSGAKPKPKWKPSLK